MYVTMVRDHWRRHRPRAWAAMSPARRDAFAKNLSAQIEQEVDLRADALEQQIPPGLPYMEKVGRLTEARQAAERQVLAEMLMPAEDDEPERMALAVDDR